MVSSWGLQGQGLLALVAMCFCQLMHSYYSLCPTCVLCTKTPVCRCSRSPFVAANLLTCKHLGDPSANVFVHAAPHAQAGRRTSLPSKNIVLVLPGNAYTPDSLEQFSAAAAAADVSLLEIAWAVAAEEPAGTSYSLSQLSQLLFDSEGPRDQYATFNMLLADKIYFKSNYKVSCSAVFTPARCWGCSCCLAAWVYPCGLALCPGMLSVALLSPDTLNSIKLVESATLHRYLLQTGVSPS